MPITGLDHVNVDTDDLDATVAFYEEVLGLQRRPKPNNKPGAWLYSGDHAVVHLAIAHDPVTALPANLNHIAFRAEGYNEIVSALEARGIEYDAVMRPDLGVTLVNFVDPNMIPIELVIPIPSSSD